jgi:hypothetical protein
MNIKPIQLQLSSEDVTRILGIALDDDDGGRALDFVKTVLAKKVEKALQRH